ncbi:AAA domain-containing protein [Caulobacter sp.]|uniref:AAA domain-containing protein n=1 Tax=Caulobacter sp. TaxID=78 RepID=UPI0031D65ED0
MGAEQSRPTVQGYALLDVPCEAGRTARVYKAVSLADGSIVAIKALTASVDQNDFLEEAFRRETEALTELRHPSIVEMRGSGITPDHVRYITLEWMVSDLIKHKRAAGPFEWSSFWASIGSPICNAVAHAHSRDIAHRDLAPRNILFGADGAPRVADFGVAKLRRFMRTEQTLREFVSPPFTPPEVDDGSGTLSRDVFSLAALFCWYASEEELTSYDAVGRFASTSERFPPAIRTVLCSALSEDPDERPATAGDLLDRIERVNQAAKTPPAALSCQLALAHHRADQIARAFELSDRGAVEQAILEDLNAICGIKPKPGHDGTFSNEADPTSELTLMGLTKSYHVKRDERSMDRLVIHAVRSLPTGLLERLRETALVPRIDFRFTSLGVQADRRCIDVLQQLIIDHLYDQTDDDVEEHRLFGAWSRILQARQDVEASRERPIRYSSFKADGRRIVFHVTGTVPEDVLQESRQIRLQDGTFLSGHVESVEGHKATFFTSSGDAGLLKPNGDIVFNVYAASEALRRQQRALDSFRQGTVVRPHLANVLIEPEKAAPIRPKAIETFFQGSLDGDKKEAVNAAMGSSDIMLLRGPPGTGKTTFVAELILQTLKEKPTARILLCSQTNVAIDNALERLVDLRGSDSIEFEVVRLGTNDERIADAVEPLRLARRLQAWTADVSTKVEAFAEQCAIEEGVDRHTVVVGMLLEKLLAAQKRLSSLDDQTKEEQQALDAKLKSKGAGASVNPRQDLDVAGSINARRLVLSQLAEERRAVLLVQNETKRELTSKGEAELAILHETDLVAAIDLYLGTPEAQRLRPLIELGAEWTARFGRQDHFEAPFLSMAHVVAGTCLGVAGPRSTSEMEFDLCIVDEASKATATEILVPLARAKKWVLVGDSKQLPPFQDEALRDPDLLEKYDLRPEEVAESLFSYLERRLPKGNVLALRTQRRMIQPISDLISGCFYPEQGLDCARGEPDRNFSPALASAVTWMDTSQNPSRGQTTLQDGSGCSNRLECELINTRLNSLNTMFTRRDRALAKGKISVAVLTGYAEQRAKLERTLNPKSPKWTHLEILLNTVDAFQGRQADVAIYSVTRSNDDGRLGFLKDAARLNVALSRGRDALIIVGDKEFCRGVHGDNPFREVITWIEKADGCGTETMA